MGLCDPAGISDPAAISPAPAQGFYVATCNGVQKVSRSGALTTILSRRRLPLGTEVLAVAAANDGLFVSLESSTSRIIHISLGGEVRTVLRLKNGSANALAVLADGSLLIVDSNAAAVLRFTRGGRLSRVAGTGNGCGLGVRDGGRATRGRLCRPLGVAPTADGGFLIADVGHSRVRKVSRAGQIATVAGTTYGFSGDGGPARAARLSEPCGVLAMSDGSFLIADSGNDRIRRVSPQGTITTVAGSGKPTGGSVCFGFGECGGGCGNVDYDPLWNYMYILGRPLRATAHRRIRIAYLTTRPCTTTVEVWQRRKLVFTTTRRAEPGTATVTLEQGLAAGSYVVRLMAKSKGKTRSDSAPLVVKG
jgi:hypothetical protein